MNRSQTPTAALAAALVGVIALVASLVVMSPARAETPTTVTLAASPTGSATVGSDVILTATVSPSGAAGWVEFVDLNGPWKFVAPNGLTFVDVIDGQASIVASGLSVGSHSFQANFIPANELWNPSSSTPIPYEITLGDDPVIDCIGADPTSVDLLLIAVPQTGGQITVPTPIDVEVPETLPLGGTANVAFAWNFVLPPNLANVAETTGAAYIDLVDMSIAINATGAASGHFAFPTSFHVEDFYETIVLSATGSVHVTDEGEISYDMATPTTLTVEVPPTLVTPDGATVALNCEFLGAHVATTAIEGEIEVPGPPTDVIATSGGAQAALSWNPPADTGGSVITSYAITSSPAAMNLTTAPNVTSIDVIGLDPATSYVFEVRAINQAGASEPATSNAVVISEPTISFTDVGPGSDFYAEISWMAETGLSTGFEPGPQYRPNQALSRQAMSAFIYRINGSPNGPNPSCVTAPFPDVAIDHPFCGEISWMKDAGITQGNPDGSFNPNGGLLRLAMSAFLYRSANPETTPNPCVEAPFTDVPADDQFCPYIAWMAQTGISEGYIDGSYKPNNVLTRMAMSAFLYRYTLVVPSVI